MLGTISAIVLFSRTLSVVNAPRLFLRLNFRDLLLLGFYSWLIFIVCYFWKLRLELSPDLGVFADMNLLVLNVGLYVRIPFPEVLAVLRSRMGTLLLHYY